MQHAATPAEMNPFVSIGNLSQLSPDEIASARFHFR